MTSIHPGAQQLWGAVVAFCFLFVCFINFDYFWLIAPVNQTQPTSADGMVPQIITGCRNFTLDFKHLGSCNSALSLQTLGPDFINQKHLSSSFFSVVQARCFCHCPWFWSSFRLEMRQM